MSIFPAWIYAAPPDHPILVYPALPPEEGEYAEYPPFIYSVDYEEVKNETPPVIIGVTYG